MTRTTLATATALPAILLSLLLNTTDGLAEVSAESRVDGGSAFVMMSDAGGGGDDPTPWPLWSLVRANTTADGVLNPDGDVNQDRRPSFAIDPASGAPHVVWSWFDGVDYEIALSWWTGAGWSAVELLTDNAVDDLDPQVAFGSNGKRRVAWSQPDGTGDDIVWLLEQVNDELDMWSAPDRVTQAPDAGMRPDVAEFGNGIRVAYEEPSNGTGSARHVMVARRDGNSWVHVPVGPSPSATVSGQPAGDLAVRIHSERNWLWIDWIDSDDVLAYSVYRVETDSWSVPETVPYAEDRLIAGNEEIAREMARRRIRQRVIDPSAAGPGG